jgi:hypothetical protein
MKYYNLKELRKINLNFVILSLYNGTEIIKKRSSNTRHYSLESNNKLAITGYKWVDNTTGIGGCGAIDLVMYLDSLQLLEAAEKLENIKSDDYLFNNNIHVNNNKLDIPEACKNTWQFVKHYLSTIRLIPEFLINDLHAKSLIWSDIKRNCVFPRDLKTGAFLRGTIPSMPFKKTIGQNGCPYVIPGDNLVIITEAPIDAISLKYYNPTATILATGGHIGFDKVEPYIINAFKVLLAQDNDVAGDQQAKKFSTFINKKVERLRPSNKFKDWNDVLRFDIKNGNLQHKLF